MLILVWLKPGYDIKSLSVSLKAFSILKLSNYRQGCAFVKTIFRVNISASLSPPFVKTFNLVWTIKSLQLLRQVEACLFCVVLEDWTFYFESNQGNK